MKNQPLLSLYHNSMKVTYLVTDFDACENEKLKPKKGLKGLKKYYRSINLSISVIYKYLVTVKKKINIMNSTTTTNILYYIFHFLEKKRHCS
jgi:hypothetical protein